MLKFDKFDRFFELQLKNEEKFKNFLDFLNLFMCKRCWGELVEYELPHHHNGAMYKLLSRSSKVDFELLEKWKLETEHGFLHGFLTCFFAFCFVNQDIVKRDFVTLGHNVFDSEVMFLSCIFHDFMKVCFERDYDHDFDLRDQFDYLSEDTYSHSNPSKVTPLVMADRVELMRYDDFCSWIDFDLLKVPIEIYGKNELDHFYRHIRPVMEKMFRHQDQVWICHVLEIGENCGSTTYPKQHWYAYDSPESMPNWFCKNTDYVRFIDEDTEKYFSVRAGRLPYTKSNCIGHSGENGTPHGLISYSNLLKNGCELSDAPLSTFGRDHLFVIEKNKIPASEWLYIFNDKNDLRKLDYDKSHVISKPLFNYTFRTMKNLFEKIQMMIVEKESYIRVFHG